MQKFSIVQIFAVFIFVRRTHIRNVQKLVPYKDFLLYGMYSLAGADPGFLSGLVVLL